jgi:mRNA interferase MazF
VSRPPRNPGSSLSRGEIWSVELDPVRGHEQGKVRPCLVISFDRFNKGPAGLAVILPITSTDRGIPLHVRVIPPEGGLSSESFIMCEMIRSVSTERLTKLWGRVSARVLRDVEDRLRLLLNL